jgi:hypothetical protein
LHIHGLFRRTNVPKGREEAGLRHAMSWVRHHDRYGSPSSPAARAQRAAPIDPAIRPYTGGA